MREQRSEFEIFEGVDEARFIADALDEIDQLTEGQKSDIDSETFSKYRQRRLMRQLLGYVVLIAFLIVGYGSAYLIFHLLGII
jgi:hypothetical protein